jgi:hypothetical protein
MEWRAAAELPQPPEKANTFAAIAGVLPFCGISAAKVETGRETETPEDLDGR